MAVDVPNLIILSIFPVLLMMAGIGDFFTMRIPNWLNGLMVVLFFPIALIAGMPMEVMQWHVLAGLLVLAVCMVLFFTISFGGGDAKMLAAGALWVGWSALIPFTIYTALAGGVVAIAVAAWIAAKHWHEIPADGLFPTIFNRKPNVPYGIAIAVGGLASFSDSWWLTSVH